HDARPFTPTSQFMGRPFSDTHAFGEYLQFDYEGGNVGEPFLTTQVPIGLLLNTEEITTHPVGVIALRLE
ncbi:MAG: hypothetical protein NT013_00175, partial [Planctomycetia bacterium]|nr:hypothetical protein [Planctomycetia bacterium]